MHFCPSWANISTYYHVTHEGGGRSDHPRPTTTKASDVPRTFWEAEMQEMRQ
jgi:hypothetical protein